MTNKKRKLQFRTRILELPRDAIKLTDSQEFINNNPESAQITQDLNLKIGQQYPGYKKVYQIIINYPNNGHKLFLINYLKLDKESMPFIWKALTETLFTSLIIYNNERRQD